MWPWHSPKLPSFKTKILQCRKNSLHPLDIFGLASLKLYSRPKIRSFFNCIHFIRPSIVWNLWFRSIVHKVSRKTSTTITSGNESIHSWLIIRSEGELNTKLGNIVVIVMKSQSLSVTFSAQHCQDVVCPDPPTRELSANRSEPDKAGGAKKQTERAGSVSTSSKDRSRLRHSCTSLHPCHSGDATKQCFF